MLQADIVEDGWWNSVVYCGLQKKKFNSMNAFWTLNTSYGRGLVFTEGRTQSFLHLLGFDGLGLARALSNASRTVRLDPCSSC